MTNKTFLKNNYLDTYKMADKDKDFKKFLYKNKINYICVLF